jgi:hypothetical protein
MNLASLTLKKWMNFRDLTDVPLHTRNYVIGANSELQALEARKAHGNKRSSSRTVHVGS